MKETVIFPEESKEIQRFEWGEVIWIHEPKRPNTERMSVGLVKIFPKSTHVRHSHLGEEQILYTLQGTGTHRLNGEEKKISQGMLLHCPPYSDHEVINTEDSDLIFMIIYTPVKPVDFHTNSLMLSREHILDYVDIDLLEDIQEEISNLLQLSFKITDAQKVDITKFTNLNPFCKLCPYLDNCKEELTPIAKGSFTKIDDVCVCNNNIVVFWIPILVNEDIIGYIKGGHLLINRPNDIEEKINLLSKENNISYRDLLKSYNDLPLVPKSRLYALEESLIVASKYISGIIENSIIQNELSDKNNEILEKTQQNINLEKALNDANKKLLKYEVSSKFNIMKYKSEKEKPLKAIEYPFIEEAQIEDGLRLLDKKSSIKIIRKILENYKRKYIQISSVKEVLSELIGVVSRTIYRETDDMDSMTKLRAKYKGLVREVYDFNGLEMILIEYTDEAINILRQALLQDDKGLIDQVNIYIKENYYLDMTLKSIAEKFYISPNYLSKIFNEQNRISLTEYINKIRIEKAKEYLIDTNIKIAMISKKVGISNISYFSHIFKKNEKCTPKEYRLRHRD
ncbi:PocR ligand-binding domain-containing protein [Wukongibacter baidiensis]|uniref:PocR ligand-binding domain-containing protein n=1 Tax=Wukongibacter baidiensis TaxID=1723361 RepID=UPI003D7FC97B